MRFLRIVLLVTVLSALGVCGGSASDARATQSSGSFSALLQRARGLIAAERIKTVIVLMMENRSFDHLLGWLHEDYSADIDGLKDGMSQPRDPSQPSLGSVAITRSGYDEGPDDPMHGFDDAAMQIDSGAMNGFVKSALSVKHNESNPVSMFDSNSAPIINSLAREFAVFDRWFCSIPGPTDPNRSYAMAGTSRGAIDNFNGTFAPLLLCPDYS
jgi:phospholipase C